MDKVTDKINIASIGMGFQDYPDPSVWTTIVYVAGCNHGCPECQNKELQDFSYPNGMWMTANELLEQIRKYCVMYKTSYVCFQGGDPLAFNNIDLILSVCSKLNTLGYRICIYTGYEVENLQDVDFSGIKWLKCGCYNVNLKQKSEKTSTYISFASKNQKLYKIINKRPSLVSKDGVFYFKGVS